jgi:predicted RNA-binding protein associated with RNAse of E/G family
VAREDSASAGAPARGQPIFERKIKADGTTREYACTLLHRQRGLVVVEFVMAKGGAIYGTPIEVPPGSVSYGFFWARRPYNLYRMRDPAGAIIAHRFDAVAAVRFGDGFVSYRDLILDWWVTPEDVLIEEDRDEYDAAIAAGTMSPDDAEAANAAAQQVYSRYRHIIDEAAAIEARFLGRSLQSTDRG